MKQRMFSALLVLVLVVSLGSAALAQGSEAQADRFQDRELPASVDAQKLDQPVEGADIALENQVDLFAGGNRFIVVLTADPVATASAAGVGLDAATQQVSVQQAELLSRLPQVAPTARVLGQVKIVLNALFIQAEPDDLAKLANDPAVLRISPVRDYQLDLSETVPYIGATAVHTLGFDGTGVRVAVLDSGIDYTHAALGGSGDPNDWLNNDPTIIEPGTFPTAKVIGGYDFVGGNWPNVPNEEPDPDPLDAGPGGGHGTHVSHIIGGVGGVAPGASLYAVKVCSSVSTSCSGVALIQGMEFAVDPNGDGDPSDHVDLINMSLGSPYGNPFDDDLSLAVDNATAAGVMTVTSCGNSADKPYAAGSPGNALTALATAQTNVPSAVQPLMEVVSPTGYGPLAAVWQSWSAPLTARVEGPLQYGDGAGGQLLGCSLGADPNSVDPANAPYPPGSLAGKIVLVDRGVCNFSVKIHNIQYGGAMAGIIGLIDTSAPFDGSYGVGGPYTISGYMISLADANLLRSLIPSNVVVAFDPAVGIPLVQHMVGSSSRGPSVYMNTLKPEIGAPGASVSAIYGTGTGEGPFGGTSGASPMVCGSAALLKQAYPDRTPLELKAALMNTAEMNIMNMPAFFGGGLAPISRIGGGEVRVDRAVAAPAAAWDEALPSGGLSFGFVDVYKATTLYKTVVVRNYTDQIITYNIANTFRFANDEASGAVTIETPPSITLGPHDRGTFYVKMTINGALLPNNAMNSGSLGADPASLTLNEYDGYLILSDASGATDPIHMAWHVLPRKAAHVQGRTRLLLGDGQDDIELRNRGLGTAQNDAYALLATSPDIPEGPRGGQAPTPDLRAVGVNTFTYGGCPGGFIWAFAINTWERQSHLLPVHHFVYLDTNMDGTADYRILNRDSSGLNTITDGRQLTYVYNLSTGAASAYFYTEHSTNTGNTVFYICGGQVGLSTADYGVTPVGVEFEAFDFYYGGPGDTISGLVVTPYAERYYGIPSDIAAGGAGIFTVLDFGAWPGDTPQLGVMLLTNGDRGAGVRGGASEATEALLFLAP